MDLIIVESPAKSKTLQGFLKNKYQVLASMGHVRDLPKSELGVDTENNFKPKYIVPLKAKKTIRMLKEGAKKAESVILATDEDREGEAIAWHLAEVLELKSPQRITFHEITKSAIENALENPRKINQNLVDSQQGRRILDRIVGYKLSPFLWKKVARGLSAGRVQSAAVRLVAEREKEINDFKKEEYWSVKALLAKKTAGKSENENFEAYLFQKDEKPIEKLGIKTEAEAKKIVADLEGADYKVEEIEKKEIKKNPLPPFTTSSLQQEAWKKLHYPAKMTMSLAQRLYEAGTITYHRTDSVNLSEYSLTAAKKYIEENLGKEYWAGYFRKYKAKKNAQEAHEAIRPAYPDKTPEILEKENPDKRQLKIYDLIWKRFVASQMAEAILNSTVVKISAEKENSPARNASLARHADASHAGWRCDAGGPKYKLKATGQTLKFAGFLKIYPLKFQEMNLPDLSENEKLNLEKITPEQHFTEPAPRYNEASLIKALEENGIGRPSTYAPILSTIQDRNYIEKDEQKRFKPTEIGTTVNNLLVEHFPKIVDIQFTAKMEEELDKIAEGEEDWVKVCRDFYTPFSENLKNKYMEIENKKISEVIPTDKKCPVCGLPLVIRTGRFGKFYACSGFPKCKHTEPLEKKTMGIKCPKCLIGEITEKKTKSRKTFYGCNRFPECDFALWDKPTGERCEKCRSLLVESKNGKIVCSNKDCKFKKNLAE